MSNINKAAVLNPFTDLTANILDYVPRATTSEFGIVAIGSGINVDALGRIYLDTQEYSDRLTAIEAQAASTLATQKSEVATAIAQVNLTQSQTITALTLEVSNLQTNLTNSIAATQTDLINRADQLAQDVTDITVQLTQDKATFTQEIQDALDFLKDDASVASALRTPRKINGTDFDGRSDITTDAWGATRTFKIGNKTNSINGTSNVDYSLADIGAFPEAGGTIQGNVEVTGNLSVDGTISATLEGIAASADKLQTPRTINGVEFDGSENITLPLASTIVSGTVQLNNTLTSTNTDHALTAAQGKVLNDNKLDRTENAVSASKLQTSRTVSLSGGVTGSVSFDGSEDASIATTVTGLGVANGIATLDANGQVPSTQLPSYVDDVLEYDNVAAFPTTGETGKIYVETTGNTTYRWSGTGYIKITSGEVSSVAGKTGVITLTKEDVGLNNLDNTADAEKPISMATQQALDTKVNITDVIDIAQGGTGASTVEEVRTNLGLGTFATYDYLPSPVGVGNGDSGTTPSTLFLGNYNKVAGEGAYAALHMGTFTGGAASRDIAISSYDDTGVHKCSLIAGSDGVPYVRVGTGANMPILKQGDYGIGVPSGALYNVPVHELPTGFFRYADGSPHKPSQMGTYDHYGFNFPRHMSGYGAALFLPYYNYSPKNICLRAYGNTMYTDYYLRHSQNTTVDSNGFIKNASPIVQLFANKIELNDEAQQQNIEFEKLSGGDYLIKGSTGLAQEGWYIEQPKDANGNIFHAVEYGTHTNGDIWLKTYEQMMDGTRIIADHTKPIDIKEDRFISIRLNELPQDTSAPHNPTIVDNEGNPAPSRLHELEEGVWVISDENVAILEQERLSAMPALKRRQFRLTLAMNGYDLNEIEALINQIEDPMQRTIAQIEWQDATEFERTNPTLLMMAQMLGLTSEQIDSLWEYGLAL